jgi:hypothetical protein
MAVDLHLYLPSITVVIFLLAYLFDF